MRILRNPYLYLTLAMLLWSGNALMGRAVRVDISPLTLNASRWVVALVVLSPALLGLWRRRAQWLPHWPLLLLLAVLGVTAFNALLYLALARTTATNASLIYANVPVLVVPFAWWLTGEPVSPRQVLGIAVSLCGVVVIITRGDPALLTRLEFNVGDLWALATVPVWALYTTLLRRRRDGLSPIHFLLLITVVGLVPLLPAAWWEQTHGGHINLHAGSISIVLYLGLFASIAAYILWNVGTHEVGANRAGLFTHLYPVFTSILAMLFLGERLFGYHLVGAILVACGLYLTTVRRARRG